MEGGGGGQSLTKMKNIFENVETKKTAGLDILARKLPSVHLPGGQSDGTETKENGGKR